MDGEGALGGCGGLFDEIYLIISQGHEVVRRLGHDRFVGWVTGWLEERTSNLSMRVNLALGWFSVALQI